MPGKTIEKGSRVRYTGEFLRNTGNQLDSDGTNGWGIADQVTGGLILVKWPKAIVCGECGGIEQISRWIHSANLETGTN